MGKRRTITYILDDGQKVTSKQLAELLGVTHSAANNRLKRSTDPKKVFKPYVEGQGGRSRGSQKDKEIQEKLKDQEMLELALKHK